MTIFGTSTKDNLVGTGGNDDFDMSQGGNDTVTALDGDDTFEFGAKFNEHDKIDGGDGHDVLYLDGDYSANIALAANSLTSVEQIIVSSGHNYNFTFDDANMSGAFTFTGSPLGAGDTLTLDFSADTDTFINVFGGAGDDTIYGGQSQTQFNLSLGGSDAATGHGGVDFFAMGGALDAGDALDGGDGTDFVTVYGADYNVTLSGATLKNIDVIQFASNNVFDFTLRDTVVGSGAFLYLDGNNVTTGSLIVDDHRETNGLVHFAGGGGDDTYEDGSLGNYIEFKHGGSDTGYGNDGDDEFDCGDALDASDSLDGGAGTDRIDLTGDYSAGLVFGAGTMTSIETMAIGAGFSYDLTLDNGNVAAGETLSVDATLLGAGDEVTLDASDERDGFLSFAGGEGDDTVTGGREADTFTGNHGGDVFTGGSGADVYSYVEVLDSTGGTRDKITDFNANTDFFHMASAVTGVDAKINTGALSNGSFNADLAAAVTAAKLDADHAVLFTPNSGTFVGRTFLIVDANGTAGYQASADYVIEVTGATHTANFDVGNFI